MEFSPELKETIKNPEQEVYQAFADFEINVEDLDDIVLERLIEIHSEEGSHFYDAIEMAKMIDKNWDYLGLPTVDKKQMVLCALLHDVGKAGPEQASEEARQLCVWLFHKQNNIPNELKEVKERQGVKAVDDREVKVMDLIHGSDYPDPDKARELLTSQGGLNIANLDNVSMIDFWRMHVDWTYDILSKHISKEVNEIVVLITASHHLLEGKNPAGIAEDEVLLESQWLEIAESYQVLTLVDKYQAFRQRSAFSHERAIEVLLTMVNGSNLGDSLKEKYSNIIAKFSDPDFMANFDLAHQEVLAKYHA